MTMEPEYEKYKRVINILKKSEPFLDSGEEIRRNVINRILKERTSKVNLSDMIDFLFRWVYIGWVRRTLIAASFALVIVFVYQQGVILRQINFLSNQVVVADGDSPSDLKVEVERKIMLYKLSGRRFPSKNLTVSERDLQKFMESINETHDKYEELRDLIDNDSELMRYLEKKLSENSRTEI